MEKTGQIYTGCNIENAAYTPTNCAERTAFFKAVSEGVKEFEAICIVGGPEGKLVDYTPPCGALQAGDDGILQAKRVSDHTGKGKRRLQDIQAGRAASPGIRPWKSGRLRDKEDRNEKI